LRGVVLSRAIEMAGPNRSKAEEEIKD
jgi:hypothetical protein